MELKEAGIFDYYNLFTGKTSTLHHTAVNGSNIISQERERFINIPAYQRPYRWDDKRIKRLFTDYYNGGTNGEYFLGSTVAVVNIDENNNREEFDLIDGQQRITTLFLLNYIRFLLYREKLRMIITLDPLSNGAHDCQDKIKETYINLLGKGKNGNFSNLTKGLNMVDGILDYNKKKEKQQEVYNEFMSFIKDQDGDRDKRNVKELEALFENEELSLKYSRKSYNDLLKYALCHVYIVIDSQKKVELIKVRGDDETKDKLAEKYLTAIELIFKYVNENIPANGDEGIDACISVTEELLTNLSICVVVSGNVHDAYQLFEVLNDRALEMDDLELIKNHFFKEYCNKSREDDHSIDNNISSLDKYWGEEIFPDDMNKTRKGLLSYLGAVYLTSKSDLDNKGDIRLKEEINENYSNNYSANGRKYTQKMIRRDFDAYYSIKLLLENYLENDGKLGQQACAAEQSDTSITFKAFNLMYALNQPGVMAAIVNLVISTYRTKIRIDFERQSFDNYIDDIKKKEDNNTPEYIKKIHRISRALRSACLMSKDYKIPRAMATKIIEKCGVEKSLEEEVTISQPEWDVLTKELKAWTEGYTYKASSNADLKLKILLLSLSSWTRIQAGNEYKASNVVIKPGAYAYQFNPRNLQLDHLEANNPDVFSERYFMYDNQEGREKIVNHGIGNFMILDKKINNSKNNAPIYDALGLYQGVNIWLVDDIQKMINDSEFATEKHVPAESFFTFRAARLYKYFTTILKLVINPEGELVVF